MTPSLNPLTLPKTGQQVRLTIGTYGSLLRYEGRLEALDHTDIGPIARIAMPNPPRGEAPVQNFNLLYPATTLTLA